MIFKRKDGDTANKNHHYKKSEWIECPCLTELTMKNMPHGTSGAACRAGRSDEVG